MPGDDSLKPLLLLFLAPPAPPAPRTYNSFDVLAGHPGPATDIFSARYFPDRQGYDGTAHDVILLTLYLTRTQR